MIYMNEKKPQTWFNESNISSLPYCTRNKSIESKIKHKTQYISKEPDKSFLRFIMEGMIDISIKEEFEDDFTRFTDFMNNIKEINIV